MTCHCEQCSDDPDYTYTDEWRHECELRWMSTQPKPEEYLQAVLQARGGDAYLRLLAGWVRE